MKMKKILATAVSVAMLSSMAMAYGDSAEDPFVDDGASISVGDLDSSSYVAAGNVLSIPGDLLENDDGDTLYAAGVDYEISADYFSVSRRTYTKGASLVSSVYFDATSAESYVAILLKSDRTLTNVTTPNFQIKEIVIRAKQDSNNDYFERNDEFTYTGGDAFYVVTKTYEHTSGGYLEEGAVNIFDLDGGYDDAQAYNSDIYLYGRVYDGDEIYFDVSTDFNKEILIANPDASDVLFYQVELDGVAATWNIELAIYEEYFVYEMKDDVLYQTSLAWDEEVYAYVGKIRSNTNYVISDIALQYTPTTTPDSSSSTTTGTTSSTVTGNNTTTTSPDTGANDVVGVAAALAVVSLVAGAAISLKK